MADTATTNDLRPAVRAQLIKLGAAPADAEETVDLAFFATQKALDTIRDVTDRAASSMTKMLSLQIALQLSAALAREEYERLTKIAGDLGAPSQSFEVKGQFNG